MWEGLRVYNGHIFNFEPHLRRMINSAKAMAFADIPTLDFVRQAVFQTLAANGMRDGVHIRMTLSRGEKTTSSMNPKFNVYGSKLVIVPEVGVPNLALLSLFSLPLFMIPPPPPSCSGSQWEAPPPTTTAPASSSSQPPTAATARSLWTRRSTTATSSTTSCPRSRPTSPAPMYVAGRGIGLGS